MDLLCAQGRLSNIGYARESPDHVRFLGRLGRSARVLWFDRRGTGMSDRNVGLPTLDLRVEDSAAVLDAAGSRQAVLFGVPEGDCMAAYAAATCPERVRSLVLCGRFARRAWAPDCPRGQTREELQQAVDDVKAHWDKPRTLDDGAPSVAGNLSVQTWFGADLGYSASPHAAELSTRMNEEKDLRPALSAIRAPAPVLHRQGDRWHPIDEGRHRASHAPGGVLRALPGGDPIPWYGDQDGLIAEVEELVTGTRTWARSERAQVTVLITGIVDSTAALDATGDDRWRMVLEHRDTGARRHAAFFGGRVVKKTGDGYVLAIAGPASAIECARALARDAQDQGLSLRVGIHTGECERRGDDLSGMAVHRAARIASRAAPGTIHTSGTVKGLSFGSGLGFSPVGRKVLKGIPGDWDVHAVMA